MVRLPHIDGSSTLDVDGRPLVLPGPVHEAWRDDCRIYALAARRGPRELDLYVHDAATLAELAWFEPPEGWSFYRLTPHPRGPSVVATNPDDPSGHVDWHFAIDADAGTLTRTAPSR